jgi:hypothetical protein
LIDLDESYLLVDIIAHPTSPVTMKMYNILQKNEKWESEVLEVTYKRITCFSSPLDHPHPQFFII